MSNRKLTLILGILVMLMPLAALAVSLEVGPPASGHPPHVSTPIPIVAGDCCRVDNVLPGFVRTDVGGTPQHVGGLTIYYLTAQNPGTGLDAVYLDDALAHGNLRITERVDSNVNELIGENTGNRPVFLMAGEMIVGGKQNRIIARDLLLQPGSGPVAIPVFCGEKRRWDRNGTIPFTGKKTMAPARLRSELFGKTEQSQIWNGIAQRLKEGKVRTATEDIQQLYENGEKARALTACLPRFPRAPKSAVGMVIYRGSTPRGVEIFGSPALFRALHNKVIAAYLMDFGANDCRRSVKNKRLIKPESVSAFVENLINHTQWHPESSTIPGNCLYRGALFSQGIQAQALLANCSLVHLGATAHPYIPKPIVLENPQ